MATTSSPASRAKKAGTVQRLSGELENAAAHAVVAKQQVRDAKTQLKKARKLHKGAKKAVKVLQKKAAAAAQAAAGGDSKLARTQKSVKKARKTLPRQSSTRAAPVKSAADVARSVIKRLESEKPRASAPARSNSDATAGANAAPESPAPP